MRLGTKIPWPYSCCLCGRGYGESTKVISMAITLSMAESEGTATDISVCERCLGQPIFKLILYLNQEELCHLPMPRPIQKF